MAYSTGFTLLILASVLGSVCSWTLQSTHQNIIPSLTDDVTLNCFHGAPRRFQMVLKTINRIVLLKLDNARRTWTPLAEMTKSHIRTVGSFNQSETDIQLDGHLGNLSTTFLKVTWPRPTSATVGTYKCEIDGYRKRNGAYCFIWSRFVHITNNAPTVAELLNAIIHMKRRPEELSNDLKQESAQHEELKKILRKEFQSSIVDVYFELRYWPSGNYGLLAPESGCPDSTSSSLVAGSATFQTETLTPPNHTFSDPNHLFGNIEPERQGTRNIFRFNICSSQRSEPKLLWPKGSYCLHATPRCPSGFQPSYPMLHPETNLNITEDDVDPDKDTLWGEDEGSGSVSTSLPHIYICCRSDGDVDNPIVLPPLKPFFLYRYKGKCQTVYNMDVREEWFQIGTNDAETDTYNNGKLHAGRFELCYYTKKTTQ